MKKVIKTYPATGWSIATIVGLLLVLVSGATRAVADACQDADIEALAWLDKMSRSVHQVSYYGVVTLHRGEDMQVMQVSHLVDDGVSAESLTRLTGQGAQVNRQQHPLECVHPGHNLLRMGDDIRQGECGVAEHYRFSVTDGDRIAGRRSVSIRVEPRDVYRFGYQLSLDRKTGLLLKTEMRGHGGRILEKFQFANLSYTQQMPGVTEVDTIHEAEHPVPAEQPGQREVARAWQATWLPSGFMATDSPGQFAGRRTFTDGLAVFSVFLEHAEGELRPGEGVVRNGGTMSYSRGLNLSGVPVLVTVVGEVPVNTARMVADSIRWMQ